MRLATWFSFYGLSGCKKSLPYSAQSPTLLQRVEYNSIEDILDEVERILQEPGTEKYGIGQSLYYQTPLFCDPSLLISEWCFEMLEDYNACKKFNIPLARSLDEAPAWKLDCFEIIDAEISNCIEHKRIKDASR